MIFLGADHAGFKTKEAIKRALIDIGQKFTDFGTNSAEKSVDYPDYAKTVALEVRKDLENRGILICGSGTGMCIAANKIKGIRASVAWDEYTAQKAKEHNNANILCLSGRNTNLKEVARIVEVWLKTSFSENERHLRRLDKIRELECLK